MSDCATCPVERICVYQYKPTECVHQRKFVEAEDAVKCTTCGGSGHYPYPITCRTCGGAGKVRG